MPATQIKNQEWLYIRGDIREIALSAQGSNRGSQRQTCWHIGKDGAAWRFTHAAVLNLNNVERCKSKAPDFREKTGAQAAEMVK